MRIRELRERRGLTGTELARMTGVTLPAVIGWENGSKTPTTDKLPTIAAVLECEIGDLYDDETLRAASEAARAAVAAKGAADARALAAGKGGGIGHARARGVPRAAAIFARAVCRAGGADAGSEQ